MDGGAVGGPSGSAGALAAALNSVDQVVCVPVAGAALRVALLVVQFTALAVLADAHHEMRVAVLDRSADLAGRVVTLVDEALAREPTAFATTHAAQLCGVLGRVEIVLNAVEATFFASSARRMLGDRVVRGWMVQLEQLDKELLDTCALGAVGYGVDWMVARVTAMERSSSSSDNHKPDAYLQWWRPPALDAAYVPGVDNPLRAEHAIVAALQAVCAGADTWPRIGVCAVGGSGKTTACAGVAACEWVRKHFSKGTAWVQLDASSTLQSVAEAVVALVHRFCGSDAAMQLSALTEDKNFVAVAAAYVRTVPVADASKWLVVIDDALYEKRELLRQLLGLIPSATPVLFSTRSEAVVSSVPGATLVSIDALPADDARLVLAKAAGKAGVPPFSASEETCWVRRVLAKTECHALSLAIVGSMIADRGGAWRPVVDALEQRWMEPDFVCWDSTPPRPSVRAALDVSFGLLPDEVCRDAFAAMGVLPVHVRVPVLARLWRFPLCEAAAAYGQSVALSSGAISNPGVDELVAVLVRAGLLRRDVDKACGELVGVIVHPVIGQYALSLLGDAARATHQRMVDHYMDGVAVDDLDAHGWRLLRLWEVPDDGSWYDHVVRHVAAAWDVCGLVSAMDRAWQVARLRVSSPLAFQADVEVVLAALMAVVNDRASKASLSPVLLGRAHAALALAYNSRIAGCRRDNIEAAVEHCKVALEHVKWSEAPSLWATLQVGLGRALVFRVAGDRVTNIEAAIACYCLALEVRTKSAAPLVWAETHKLLGDAYDVRVVGDKAANMETAIAHYQRSLEVWTRPAAPREWAGAQNSLAVAYRHRINGDEAANVEEAIAYYRRSLEVRTRTAEPVLWAKTRYNLGIAYYNRLVGDKAASIEAAIACYEDTLTVCTREAAPLMWAAAQNHRGKALRDRLFGDPAANKAAAVACFDRALTVRTRVAVPLNWAETQHNMGVTHHDRQGSVATGVVDVDAAVTCYRRALEVRTPQAAPQQWALTTFCLLLALMDGECWSAVIECGGALERFGRRWAAWPAHQGAVARAVSEARRALFGLLSEPSGN
ncbi:hypothetical protein BU14_0066s0014 [Porphyra umbilicalis]|uniref:NB-ARC domain-containing protein n=1 Tax=Porphyra umbilicalis TaxID=2786 RepID=A0A1X6PGI1_PORUM|nr:hypothetical protein BU14_0066s0014 [Porphyra umbilicalis]|eukprot:OSX79961.1 hypothetical protein BU14_0066s0014 [Porphyra umbilicalis]